MCCLFIIHSLIIPFEIRAELILPSASYAISNEERQMHSRITRPLCLGTGWLSGGRSLEFTGGALLPAVDQESKGR